MQDPRIPQFVLGQPILDRFTVERIIRRGGTGNVYVVSDIESNRWYAVKVPKQWSSLDHSIRIDEFRREVERLILLPPLQAIVPLHRVETIVGIPHAFLEYVPNGSLADLLARTSSRKLPLRDSLRYALYICHAMDHVHRTNNLVHLDLKPCNLLIDREGKLRVADFGNSVDLTNSSGIILSQQGGTPLFMPPEQWRGEAIGFHSDIYSCGLVLHMLLTGSLPSPLAEMATSSDAAHLYESIHALHCSRFNFHDSLDPTPLSAFPPSIHSILRHCLDSRTTKRIQDFPYLKEWITRDFSISVDSDYAASVTPGMVLQKAISLQSIGLHSRSLEYFNQYLRQKPNDRQALLSAARSLAATGQHRSAAHLNNLAIIAEGPKK